MSKVEIPDPETNIDVSRHGAWDKSKGRCADGESSHPCGLNCSVGAV